MHLARAQQYARSRILCGIVSIALTLGHFSGVQAASLDITRATVPEVQAAYATGRLTAERVTAAYLARIAAYEEAGPAINAIIHMNPDALAQAKALDVERKAGRVRGPLHGIPIVLKDLFDTYDLPTTAGSQLLAGSIPSKDAFVTQKLREAGVIIIAKVNMAEFANSGGKVPLGYSSGGLQTLNPHALDRSPGSSSGGTGSSVAAAFAQFGLGTDSQGSVRGPSSANGIVGLKTTHGLISKDGVIPLTLSLDTVGPMARNVTDIAYAMNVMVGVDPADDDTLKSVGRYESDYTRFLKADSLKGARIGIARQFMGADAEIDKATEAAIDVLRQQGAIIIDSVKFPEHLLGVRGPIWPFLEASEFRAGVTDYLQTLKPGFPKSFEDLVKLANDPATNYRSPEKAELFKSLSERAMELDDPEYIALTKVMMPAFTIGVESVFEKHKLTAMFYPTSNNPTPKLGPRPPRDTTKPESISATSIASQSGLPEIVIPAGMSQEGMPITVSFLGRAWSDAQLISLAYAFEQATHGIRTPSATPTLKTDLLRY
jgi:amidase